MAFSAEYMLQDLAYLALWVWVQDKSRPRHKQKSSCLFCTTAVKSTLLPTWPPNRTPNPTATTGKGATGPVQDGKELTYSATAPFSCTCLAPSTCIGSAPRGDKGGPSSSWLWLQPPPYLLAHILKLDVWGWDALASAPPVSPHPAHAKRPPPPPPTSSVALAVATEGAPQRPYSCSGKSSYGTFAWHLEAWC